MKKNVILVFVGFRCCYCNVWNPPRKQKPGVQRIEDVSSNVSPTSGTFANDSSDKNTEISKHSEVEASCSSDTGNYFVTSLLSKYK